MRRYRIVVTSPQTSSSTSNNSATASAKPSLIYDSQFKNTLSGTADNTGALDVNFDVSVQLAGISNVGSYVEISGLGLNDVANIRKYEGGNLTLFGGFSGGFPLANANQYGQLFTGGILQAFGNWTGDHQSISFILGTPFTNKEFAFNWQPNQKLSQAVSSTISKVYPGITLNVKLNNDPVGPAQGDMHYCYSIQDLGAYISNITASMNLGINNAGISLITNSANPTLTDTPLNQSPTQIQFNDLQGQPVYLGYSGGGGSSIIQVPVNLRSDLGLLSNFTLSDAVSKGYMLTNPASPTLSISSQTKNTSAINGTYTVNNIRHVGSFRAPAGDSWLTVLGAVPYFNSSSS